MIKIILAIVMISAVCFSGCKTGNSGDPKSVLVKFFEALSKNDVESARNLATKDSKTLIDMMMKMGNKGDEKGNNFDITRMQFSEARIQGDKAIVPVKERTSGETLNYTLKKEDGVWKVALDKSSMMEMGMDKMNEKGINLSDSMGAVMDKLKDINLDSLKEGMGRGMDVIDSVNKEIEKNKTP
ncbi:MAG: hypothetical protein ABIO04_05405 [Ferruginibacter sp.]